MVLCALLFKVSNPALGELLLPHSVVHEKIIASSPRTGIAGECQVLLTLRRCPLLSQHECFRKTANRIESRQLRNTGSRP